MILSVVATAAYVLIITILFISFYFKLYDARMFCLLDEYQMWMIIMEKWFLYDLNDFFLLVFHFWKVSQKETKQIYAFSLTWECHLRIFAAVYFFLFHVFLFLSKLQIFFVIFFSFISYQFFCLYISLHRIHTYTHAFNPRSYWILVSCLCLIVAKKICSVYWKYIWK